MQVWVVYPDFGYEGYGKIEGVFSTFDLAKEYVAKEAGETYRSDMVISEHCIDAIGNGRTVHP